MIDYHTFEALTKTCSQIGYMPVTDAWVFSFLVLFTSGVTAFIGGMAYNE